jgi:hypothetical protein
MEIAFIKCYLPGKRGFYRMVRRNANKSDNAERPALGSTGSKLARFARQL